MEHLAPPTDPNGHTKFDMSVCTEKYYHNEELKYVKYVYVSEINVWADDYENVSEPFSRCIEDQRYHTQDVLPPIVIRLRRQHVATDVRSGETTDVARKATGTWTWGYTDSKYHKVSETLELKQAGEKLNGTLTYSIGGERVGKVDEIVHGRVEKHRISFEIEYKVDAEVHTCRYTGQIKGDLIVGSVEYRHGDRDSSIEGWEARRVSD
jgi:hypothetical protein